MKELAQDICNILHDYHNQNGFQFTSEHIIKWVSQFDEGDQRFILEELLNLLNKGIYISKEKGKDLLLSSIKELTRHYGFNKISEFLKNVDFLRLQDDTGNSQDELLGIMDDVLYESYGVRIKDCGSKSKKYALYIDDIFATGNTAFQGLKKWLLRKEESGRTNLEEVMSQEKEIIISVFCLHNWGRSNIGARFKMDNAIGKDLSDKILYLYGYKVENHPTIPGQKLNFAYPVRRESQVVSEYLDGLPKGRNYNMSKKEYAMRDAKKPSDEKFFSSAENRIRFENILLLKGIEILKKVGTLKPNQRPMGNVNPSFQTLGTGTLFFAWRNISNTTPVVFWWEAKHWNGLFPLSNRGN